MVLVTVTLDNPHFDWPLTEEYLHDENDVERRTYFYNAVQARYVKREEHENLVIYSKPTGQSVNTAVRKFTRGGTCSGVFRGPHLILRQGKRADGYEEIRDVDSRDLRNAADFFTVSYRQNEDVLHLEHRRFYVGCIASPVHVQAGIERFSGTMFNGADPVFFGSASGIANLLGIPLLIRTADRIPADDVGNPQGMLHNQAAALIQLDITSTSTGPQNPRGEVKIETLEPHVAQVVMAIREARGTRYGEYAGSNGFGTTPEEWSGDTGGVFIARADGRPLMGQHLEALCAYIEQRVCPRIRDALEGHETGTPVAAREAVLDSITKQDFRSFYQNYVMSKYPGEAFGSDVAQMEYTMSPYDMKGEILRQAKSMAPTFWQEQVDAGNVPYSQRVRNQR